MITTDYFFLKHSLYIFFQEEVDELQSGRNERGFVRVAFAGGITPPADVSDADGLMDWFDQRGVIDAQWQKVKTLMESARNLDMKAKRGEED